MDKPEYHWLCRLIGHRIGPEPRFEVAECRRCRANNYYGFIPQPWHIDLLIEARWRIRRWFRHPDCARRDLKNWWRCPCCGGRLGRHDEKRCLPF